MHTGPLVSVIIPMYNAERYVGSAIQSVLEQTCDSFEIIVIDDGSEDGSAAVVSRFPTVRYRYQENGGISAARNHGIGMARGDFFALLDADDLWEAEKLERQLDAFAQEPGLDMVFGHILQFRSGVAVGEQAQSAPGREDLEPGYIPTTMMVRRESFFRVGLFDLSWKMGEFADWYVRAQELGLKKKMLPDLVARRRIHGSNNGLQQRASINDYLRILKGSLDRRRAMQAERPDPECL